MRVLSQACVHWCRPHLDKTQCAALFLALALSLGATAEVKTSGYLELGAERTNSEKSWIRGGTGTLGSAEGANTQARLGFDFNSESRFSAHLSVLARASSASERGRRSGLLDAYVDYGNLSDDRFRVRTGLSFSGSSVENVEDFWQTPYTLSLSALNSWIGEEFRPLGVTATKRIAYTSGASLDLSFGVFGGNDTSAALLAWRGFAVHNRLSVFGESLPLLPLPSLRNTAPRGGFGAQRDDGSQPLSCDLDGRPGFLLRARQSLADGGHINAFFTDNRGDRKLHGDEYAWHTRFGVLGFDQPLNDEWTLLGEVMHGRTNMGFPPGPNVAFAFDASYLALSRSVGLWTISTRAEAFHINELDRSAGERNTQNGIGGTFAVLRNAGDWRLGFEAQYFDITRPGNTEFGGDIQQGGTQIRVLARRYF
jgi:hypothetical protein